MKPLMLNFVVPKNATTIVILLNYVKVCYLVFAV